MFQYFISTTSKSFDPDTHLRGIEYLGRDNLTWTTTTAGPSGDPGLYVSIGGHQIVLQKYNVDDWVPATESGNVLVRMHAQPVPESLERDVVLHSYNVTLEDGNLWKLPRALRWNAAESYTPDLPQIMQYTPGAGWKSGTVIDKYAALWSAAMRVMDSITSGSEMTPEEEWDVVMLCIQTNYRIGPVECSLAKLFVSMSPLTMLMALIDGPGQASLREKKTDG